MKLSINHRLHFYFKKKLPKHSVRGYKKPVFVFVCAFSLMCCKSEPKNETPAPGAKTGGGTDIVDEVSPPLVGEPVKLNLEKADKLAKLPLKCATIEYPNKLGQVIGGAEDLAEPHELHPAFYGCFDWHSAVHAHWSLVGLLKQFPDLEQAQKIRETLKKSLSEENIQGEVDYFQKEINKTYERTYGWAWLLQLATELHAWDDPLARDLETNLQPLTNLIVQKFQDFLPKLNYPIRTGEHSNTAFALALAYDYAKAVGNNEFLGLIEKSATDFYLEDNACPLQWEPGGFDFLSPCLSEIDIMRRVLSKNAFQLWMKDFMPQLQNENFSLEMGKVADRSDGKLVHLDGLNFSRAWVLAGLANQYPEQYSHLKPLAQEHLQHSFPNLFEDTYEGGHWLGSFAIYALNAVSGAKQFSK